MTATNFPNGVSVTKRNRGWGQIDVVNRTKVIRIRFDDNTAEFDTNFTLPATAVVQSLLLNVLTAEVTGATPTIDVGTATTSSGVPNGYMIGISVAATGLVKPSLLDGAVTMGALISEETGTGADVAYAPTPDIVSGGKTISWSPGGNDFAELVADVVINYQEIV